MKRFCFLLFLIPLLITRAQAQKIDRNQLGLKVLPLVDSIGPMKGSPLKYIVDAFAAHQLNEIEMSYALYCWTAANIEFDTRAYHRSGSANTTASEALNKRETIGLGYANLYKALCDLARIECVVIEGHAKTHPESIGDFSKAMKHAWNGVRIRNTWYYADAAFGAGLLDRKIKTFTKEFNDVWWFGNRDLFLLSHFPSNKKWQFTEELMNKSVFVHAPVIGAVAMKTGIFFDEGLRGRIRGKAEDCKRIVLQVTNPADIKSVGVTVDENVRSADYYLEGNNLYIDIPFQDDGNYPLLLTINGKPAFGFKAEVSPKVRRS